MTFREEVQNILLNKRGNLNRTLNAIESAHKRHRNLEIEAKLTQKANNTKLSKLLHRDITVNKLKETK